MDKGGVGLFVLSFGAILAIFSLFVWIASDTGEFVLLMMIFTYV